MVKLFLKVVLVDLYTVKFGSFEHECRSLRISAGSARLRQRRSKRRCTHITAASGFKHCKFAATEEMQATSELSLPSAAADAVTVTGPRRTKEDP